MNFEAVAYGKYFLLDKLATGGMAEVFKAKTYGVRGFERLLVIKRILPHLTKDREFVEMFIDEAKIAVELTHANIVQVFDLGKISKNYFIAMEYVNGKDLRAILKKCQALSRKLDISFAAFIAMEVLKGLSYAHNKKDPQTGEPFNVIHRDISPQNVMVSYDGAVKIVDFGIAKAEKRLNETQVGVLKGKFGYMSPEQAMGMEIDCRTDIFSTGIILFEMITGRRLFLGENDLETLELIRNAEVPRPSKYNSDVPVELEEIIFRALNRDPEERYAAAKDMQVDLTKFLYSYKSDFTASELSSFLQDVFRQEMQEETLKLQEAMALEPAPGLVPPEDSTRPRPKTKKAISSKIREEELGQGEGSLGDYAFSSSDAPWVEGGEETLFHKDSRKLGEGGSGSLRELYPEAPEEVSFRQWIKPWIMPGLLLSLILVLLYWNFFRTPAPNEEMLGASKGPKPTAIGKIDVTSYPTGAMILVNGDEMGPAPVTLSLEAGKEHPFLARKEGYQDQQLNIFIEEGVNTPLQIALEKEVPIHAMLRITSKPSGAMIFINGEETEKSTPYTFTDLLRSKSYAIKLHRRGYKMVEKNVTLDKEEVEKHFVLKPRQGKLRIKSDPNGAVVFINGKRKGKTPYSGWFPMFTNVNVKLVRKGYQSVSEKVQVTKGVENLRFSLAQAILEYGYLSANADPWAMVYIDGDLVGNTPLLAHKIPVGRHTVEFRHSDFPSKQKVVNVTRKHTTDSPLVLIIDLRGGS
jgi:serine/threonine protein kinase